MLLESHCVLLSHSFGSDLFEVLTGQIHLPAFTGAPWVLLQKL